jgi:uncharacterized protein with GYD domain
MATFIALVNFTDQGIRNVKDSPDRFQAFKQLAEKAGVAVKSVFWTIGHYDLVVIAEGTDEAMTSVLLKVGSLGNIRTETLRGFSADEFKQILAKMP